MARGNTGSWANGSAPAQGSAGVSQGGDGACAQAFLRGLNQAANNTAVDPGDIPSVGGSQINHNPRVWGRGCKCP